LSCVDLLRAARGPDLLVTYQTAENLARTFAGKYSWAQEAGHAVVTGLDEILNVLRVRGDTKIGAIVVEGEMEQFIVILTLHVDEVLAVMRVVPRTGSS
jgi:hypothetical protein